MSQWVGNQRAQSLSTLDEHIFSVFFLFCAINLLFCQTNNDSLAKEIHLQVSINGMCLFCLFLFSFNPYLTKHKFHFN